MKLIREFYKEHVISRTLPVGLKPGDEGYFGNTSYTIKSSGLYFIRNAALTPLGIIYENFRSKKEFIVCYDIDFKNYKSRYLLKTLLKFRKQTLDRQVNYLVLFDNYSGPHGFAHWLCDGLTRIAELNDELKEYTALLPAYFKYEKLYLDSLQYFKISKIAYLEDNTLARVPKLYIPSHIAGTGNFNPKNLRKLRAIVLPQIKPVSKPVDRIYISRAKSSRRFVTNEQELCHFLEGHGFTILYFEDYSFGEQLDLISHAEVVISTHGAALALIMFMKEGAHVLEFRKSSDRHNNMYYSLCDAVNVNYHYLRCAATEIDEHANNFDLEVSLDELQAVVEPILSDIKR